ncbi:MAG TPA: bacitracin ABC transporter ATP-binding protein [Clostridiales bacterium]|nr:bacitracin ABC transporter ATP-binding protein [Clostridiales bacterium]
MFYNVGQWQSRRFTLEYLLETDNITKKYGKITAVDHVSIHLKKGEIYGLIGRNGAGKTTLLKMLAGLAKPTEGNYSIFGESEKETAKLRDRIGVLIESPGLYPNMTALENMKIKALMLGMNDDAFLKELLADVGLDSRSEKLKVKQYSLGMKQRLGIAMTLVGHPDLLLLDEPINGLDPQGIVEIRELIARLSKERNITILISSHILEELSKISTRYGILHNGQLIDEFTHSELLRRCRERIEIRPSDATKAVTVIEKMGITEYKVLDKSVIQIFERLEDSGEIVLELAKNNIKTLGIAVKNEALEDYYLSLTGSAMRREEAGKGKE